MAGEPPTIVWITLLTACRRKTRLILDKMERIVAVLVGQPDDPQWRDNVDTAAGVMREVEELGANADLFTVESLRHRRGEFLALPAGVSFGGGQTVSALPRFFSL
jgi:hypothetical protein